MRPSYSNAACVISHLIRHGVPIMKTLVIVGAGYCGVATAAHILRSGCRNLRIILINSTRPIARGLAYGTNSPFHLLNASVEKMSALEDVPGDFLKFCRRRHDNVEPSSYVSRSLYGAYLNDVLDTAERVNPHVQLSRIVGQVTQAHPCGEGARLKLSDGRTLQADQVVLAFGNFPAADCCNLKKTLRSESYSHDPWNLPTSFLPDPESAVLLIGTGLTAVDTALQLVQMGHRGSIHLLSRRGLWPLSHQQKVAAPFPTHTQLDGSSPRQLMATLRKRVREHQRNGSDWRPVIDGLRPILQKLWSEMDTTEQRQFLRHVQPWWDVHRHRMAPSTFDQFRQYLDDRQCHIHAGRLVNVAMLGKSLIVDFRRRKDQATETLKVCHIINCTGPNLDIHSVSNPLVDDLLEQGLITAGPCKLGLLVDDDLRVLDRNHQPVRWLSYVGPMLKAQHWEATAVPELRRFSYNLATRMTELLGALPGAPGKDSSSHRTQRERPLERSPTRL